MAAMIDRAAIDIPKSKEELDREDRARLVAFDRARSIQEKKKLHEKVLDTIIVAFDLPSDQNTDAAHPTAADANAFLDCLRLFRPQDLDEVVSERNIDRRCGYALCRNAIDEHKVTTWQHSRVAASKWCSTDCRQRDAFVRKQLNTEPVWLRESELVSIRLLSDAATTAINVQSVTTAQDALKQEELALERGVNSPTKVEDFSILEKETTTAPKPPKYTSGIRAADLLEGLPIRTARTSKNPNS